MTPEEFVKKVKKLLGEWEESQDEGDEREFSEMFSDFAEHVELKMGEEEDEGEEEGVEEDEEIDL